MWNVLIVLIHVLTFMQIFYNEEAMFVYNYIVFCNSIWWLKYILVNEFYPVPVVLDASNKPTCVQVQV